MAPLCLCALVAVSAAPAQDKVLLARKAKVGEVSRNSSEAILAIDAGGQQMTLAIKETDKVTITAVAADGAITSSGEVESMEISMNGQAMPPQPSPPASTSVIRPDGSLVKSSQATPDGVEGRMHHASRILFSDKPVGAGDTWTREVKADPSLGVRAATAEYKVVAFEKVGAVDTVKISMSFRETAADGISAAGTFWIEKSTGDEVKAEYEFKNVPFPQMGLVSGSARGSRLSAGG